MADGIRTRRLNKIKKDTRDKMKSLGVYKTEFEEGISRYAHLTDEYNRTYEAWVEKGCPTISMVPNTKGYMVEKKDLQFSLIQELRRDIANTELLLGLNPKGLKALQTKGLEQKKTSSLGEALKKLSGGE